MRLRPIVPDPLEPNQRDGDRSNCLNFRLNEIPNGGWVLLHSGVAVRFGGLAVAMRILDIWSVQLFLFNSEINMRNLSLSMFRIS